jgi:hypothetical protein
VIAAAKQSGKQSLEGYEKTLASLLSFGEKVAGATQLDWVSALAKAHATFVTETTAAFTGDQDTQPFQLAADWFMGALPRAAILRLSGAHAAPIESRKDFVSALGGFVLEIERENSQTSECDGPTDSSPGALGGKGPT